MIFVVLAKLFLSSSWMYGKESSPQNFYGVSQVSVANVQLIRCTLAGWKQWLILHFHHSFNFSRTYFWDFQIISTDLFAWCSVTACIVAKITGTKVASAFKKGCFFMYLAKKNLHTPHNVKFTNKCFYLLATY